MTDSLGQSQVIPYVIGLTNLGNNFVIVSAEKKENYYKKKEYISNLLKSNNIIWHPIIYTKKPPIFSTIWDIIKLKSISIKLHKKYNFNIVHCRSYITSFVGLALKRKYSVKFVFDMRAFYADERIDGKLWNDKNIIYSFVYRYFKRKEIEYLSNADYTISLTNAGKEIINSWDRFNNNHPPIEVIPCCADLKLFSKDTISLEEVKDFKAKHNISESDFVISYLGSTGTWYMLDEMLLFFKRLLLKKETAKFLFITNDKKEEILDKAAHLGISITKIIIVSAKRDEVPTLLSISKVSMFFIKPVFSKKASSPTKMGEILGMGIPIICNSNVGDVDDIILSSGTGLVIDKFNDESYDRAIDSIDALINIPEEKFLITAQNIFSLQRGVEKYNKVYKLITKAEK